MKYFKFLKFNKLFKKITLSMIICILCFMMITIKFSDFLILFADDGYVDVWDGESSDKSFFDYSDNILEISTGSQLKGFSEMCDMGFDFSNYIIKLVNDIDLNNNLWVPIENYAGIFDGQNHTIYNGYILGCNPDGNGFFRTFEKRTIIKNLNFSSFRVISNNNNFKNMAILVGINNAYGTEILNCKFDKCFITSTLSSSSMYAGTIAVESNASILVDGCEVLNSVINGKAKGRTAGFIYEINHSEYDSVIKNSLIIDSYFIGSDNNVGLFVSDGGNCTKIDNCVSNMWPEFRDIEEVKDKLTTEMVDACKSSFSASNRYYYSYAICNNAKITNSGSFLNYVSLDDEILDSYFDTNDLFLTTSKYDKYIIKFGTKLDYEINHNGTLIKGCDSNVELNLDDKINVTSVVASFNGNKVIDIFLISNVEGLITINNKNNENITTNGEVVRKNELTYVVSDLQTAPYTLNIGDIPDYLTLKNENNILSNSSINLTLNDDKYETSLKLVYNNKEYDFNYVINGTNENQFIKVDDVTYNIANVKGEVLTGVTISLNESYPWDFDNYDGVNFIKSTNQKINSSSSYVVFNIEPNKVISFLYSCSSENNWDYLYFEVDGNSTNTKGMNNQLTSLSDFFNDDEMWTKYTYENNSSDVVSLKVYYKKDSSGQYGMDTAFIKDIEVNDIKTTKEAIRRSSSENYGTLFGENLYYKFEDENEIAYDEVNNLFMTLEDKASYASITFTITNSDTIYFEYDDSTYYSETISVYLDGVETLISGDKESGFNYLSYTHKFDTVGVHTIKVEFTYYDWYAFSIKNPKALLSKEQNVKILVEGDGEVFDIYDFGEKKLDINNSYLTLSKLQLFGTTLDSSKYEYVGYKIKNSDDTFGDLITSNGDILTVWNDLEIKVIFKERIDILSEVSYTIMTDSIIKNESKLYNYDCLKFNEVPTNTELILQVKDLTRYNVKVEDNGISKQTLSDSGVYYYKINDFNYTHKIKFTYYNEVNLDTSIYIIIDFDPDINKYLIIDESKDVEIINDSSFPLVYSPEKSDQDRTVFLSSNQYYDDTASEIALKVKGSGVIVFDYYISSESGTTRYDTADCGDKVLYGINTPLSLKGVCVWDNTITNYNTKWGHILDEYKTKVGYLGSNLGDDDLSKCQGELGWQSAVIPVSGSDDTETIVYISYIKDSSDYGGEDVFGIANVGFISADFDLSFSTNSKTSNISVKNGSEDVLSGSTIEAGSKLSFIVNNSNQNEKFYGWVNSDGKIISKELSFEYSIASSLDLKATFITDDSKVLYGNTFYKTISEAINSLSTTELVTMYVLNNYELNEDLIIPSNVTLILPYDMDDKTGFKIGETSVNRPSWGRGVSPFITLTINDNVTLTIEGNLIVGGVQHSPNQHSQGMTSGSYAEVINNGKIIVNNLLDVRGLVSGTGKLILNDDATLKEPFMVNNYSGGTNTSNLYSNNQFPFVQFANINIQCEKIINYGSKVIGTTSLYFWSSITTQDVVLIDKIENRNLTDEGSLIWMHEGSTLNIKYLSQSINEQVGNINLSDSGINYIMVDGTITAGEFYLQSYGSKSMFLSIPYTYQFELLPNSKVIIDQKYKLMPGSMIKIDENATLEITSTGSLLVYSGLKQAGKSGKEYPSSEILERNGFNKSGMLINNGLLNIYGQFLGIIQATKTTGVIYVDENANVSPCEIIDGALGGYTDNLTTFTLNAEVYNLYGLTTLQTGKTYKVYDLKEFNLNNLTFSYYEGNSGSSTYYENYELIINQLMSGRFLEYYNGSYYGNVQFYIGEEVEGVRVYIENVEYITGSDGKFVAYVKLDDFKFYNNLDNIDSYHSEKVEIDNVTTLHHVIKDTKLLDSNIYERLIDINGNITQDFNLKYEIIFYGGNSEIDELLMSIDETKYVILDVTLNGTNYNVSFIKNLYIEQSNISLFINDYHNLSSSNLINDSVNLYNLYLSILEDKSNVEITYIQNKLSDYMDFLDIIKEIEIGSVIYGTKTCEGTGTKVNGEKVIVEVTTSNYNLNNGEISCVFKYTSYYKDIQYEVKLLVNNIISKEIVVNIDDKSQTYGDDEVLLTGSADLVNNDEFDEVIRLVKQVGSDVGTYEIDALRLHPGYTLTVNKGTYTISKRKIDVKVLDHKPIYEMYALNISDLEVEISNVVDDNYVVSFELLQDNNVICKIDENGNVSTNLSAGKYEVRAVIASNNYEVINNITSYLEIIDNSYYDVFVYYYDNDSNNITSKVYDGTNVNVTVKVYKHSTNEEVNKDLISYTLSNDTEIKNAKKYIINVKVDDIEYNGISTFEVQKRTLILKLNEQSSIYDGLVKTVEFNILNKVGNDDVKVDNVTTSSVIADFYKLKPSNLIGNDALNYELNDLTYDYTILPFDLEVTINKTYQVYGDNEKTISFTCDVSIPSIDNIYNIIKLEKIVGNDVGCYDVVCIKTNDNYNVTFKNELEAYVITRKTLNVIIDDLEVTYGCDLPEFTYSIQGLVESDKSLPINEIFVIKKEEGNDVGTYLIYGQNVSINYDIKFTNGTCKINKAPITLKIEDSNSIYGENLVNPNVVIKSGSLKYHDEISSLIEVVKEEGLNVGTYLVTSSVKTNNYDITTEYSNKTYSIYKVMPRPIVVKINDVVFTNNLSFDEANKLLSYEIENGTIIDGDDLNISLSMVIDSHIITSLNYYKYLNLGIHQINGDFDNNNYDVTFISGILNIIKPQVEVINIKTEYIYNGSNLDCFNYKDNISGYLDSATESSFKAWYYLKDDESKTPVDLINAGEYVMVVEIVHTVTYDFKENSQTEFDIVVNKLDISNNIKVIGLEKGNYVIKGTISSLFVDLDEYDLSFVEKLYQNGELVDTIDEVGNYKYVVEITDSNYQGSKIVEFKVLPDISEKINSFVLEKEESYQKNGNELLYALSSLVDKINALSDDEMLQIENNQIYNLKINDIFDRFNEVLKVKEEMDDLIDNFKNYYQDLDNYENKYFIYNIINSLDDFSISFIDNKYLDVVNNVDMIIINASNKLDLINEELLEYNENKNLKLLLNIRNLINGFTNEELYYLMNDELYNEISLNYEKTWNEFINSNNEYYDVVEKSISSQLVITIIIATSTLSLMTVIIKKHLV